MHDAIVDIKGLKNYLGGQWVHEDVSLSVKRGEIIAIIGGSGSGKTTVLRSLLMLLTPTEGDIRLFGHLLSEINFETSQTLKTRIGMLFQKSALFSSFTVLENVMFPLSEHTDFPIDFIKQLSLLKLLMVGLSARDAHKYPSELSGGMQKRAAAARALALEPELLFLDEPVSGLDPHSAKEFDELLLFLREQLGLTIIMVSHDLSSLKRATDRVIFLGEGRVLAEGPVDEVMQLPHPLIQDYFQA